MSRVDICLSRGGMMAGDVPVREIAVVLGAEGAPAVEAAAEAAHDAGGRVLHRFGPRVVVIEATEEVEADVRSAVRGGAAELSPAEALAELDTTGALGLEALTLRVSDQYAEAKAQRPLHGESWDSAEA